MRLQFIVLLILCGYCSGADAQDARNNTVAELSKRLAQLEQKWLEKDGEKPPLAAIAEAVSNFRFGGYGEIHANFGEGSSTDEIDIHRFVIYTGYEFADWIQLHSELEIEHAFVRDDDGEISFEQLHIDFLLSKALNIRFGRILSPMGLVNQKHEPPTFNGVERPTFSRSIIPSTWNADGIGVFGEIRNDIKYELYVVSGLDGTGFTDVGGIRGGRIKERPSLNEVAVVGRLDYYPFVRIGQPAGQTLRLGLSAYHGGLENGNRGVNPDLNAEISIVSTDFEWTIGKLDFRGAAAFEDIDGAENIGANVADQIFGYYVEAALRWLPRSWKKGKLRKSEAIVFCRYDRIDTQFKMGSGLSKNPAGELDEVTVGLGWFFTPQLVAKLDVQIRNDNRRGDLPTLVNLGLGWEF